MSRIGRMPIAVPAGVTVDIAENNKVTVKGPMGELVRVLPAEMEIKLEASLAKPSVKAFFNPFPIPNKTIKMYNPKATVNPESTVRNTLLRMDSKISLQRSISNIINKLGYFYFLLGSFTVKFSA